MTRTLPSVLFFALIIKAYSDCYFAFLQASGPCSSDSDCGGSPCVMDVKSGSHVCCKPKPGTTAPRGLFVHQKRKCSIVTECPGGMTYTGIPVLCDPADGDDGCPAGYTCSASSSDFTKDSASPNSLCCKA
ncbi:Protein CBG14231 [Caenorhabditis briggsae]|uniref:Protein CBG14231 n=1 Tax=Caenorhabditis briggsae TaxID=6238 RepID=A8XJK1_CAEBR|nr:Protein CBG14231 [Caenorhabditis briggsae]CAP32827.2 Protein CBG14231 [Caenorhabditis briggsae]